MEVDELFALPVGHGMYCEMHMRYGKIIARSADEISIQWSDGNATTISRTDANAADFVASFALPFELEAEELAAADV